MSADSKQRKRPSVAASPSRPPTPRIGAEEASGLQMLAALKAAKRLTSAVPQATREPFAREVEKALRGAGKTSPEAAAAAEMLLARARLRFA